MTTPSNTPAPAPEPYAGAVPPGSGPVPGPASHAATTPYAGAPHAGAPHAGGPYGAAPYGAASAAAGARPGRNVLGIVALGLGVVVMLSGSASLVVQASLMRTSDYTLIAGILGAFAMVQGALALAAIVCGGIGLALKGRAKGAAGIGLGIGAAELWAVLGGFFYTTLLQLLA